MKRDDEYTRLLGEIHRILDNSVPKKDYEILTNCLRSCRNMLESAIVTMERPYSKKTYNSTTKDMRIFLNVLDGHLKDPWVLDPQRDTSIGKHTKFEDYTQNSLIREHWKKAE